MRRFVWIVLLAVSPFALVSPACAETLRLATTTSTANSGLLAHLLPDFEKKNQLRVQVISLGTGAALRVASQGDADVVLVHARSAEDAFVASGHGILRRDVMYNDFVIAGAPTDPAGVRGNRDVVVALRGIRERNAKFVSRGDQSGTHLRELELWKAAGIEPKWDGYYLSLGQGMGAALAMAYEKRAYVLTDRGTYLAYHGKNDLEVLVEGDRRLHNPYGVIAVNPQRHARVNHEAAVRFIEWLTSPATQRAIGEFRVGGQRLFFPANAP